jgi:hypothetical protein
VATLRHVPPTGAAPAADAAPPDEASASPADTGPDDTADADALSPAGADARARG